MPQMPVDLEIERLKNLVTGFGWSLEEKKISKTEIVVVLKKEIKPA